jgi:adenylate cyclase
VVPDLEAEEGAESGSGAAEDVLGQAPAGDEDEDPGQGGAGLGGGHVVEERRFEEEGIRVRQDVQAGSLPAGEVEKAAISATMSPVRRNLEIKARVRDAGALASRAAAVAGGPPEVLRQEDTFYPVSEGRLKLRVLAENRGELIYYRRADVRGPKASSYAIAPTDRPQALGAVLEAALGSRTVVRKRRTVFLAGRTRIHLDEVQDLGSFVELECVLGPGDTLKDAEAELSELMDRLGVAEADLIEGAYADLLAAERG